MLKAKEKFVKSGSYNVYNVRDAQYWDRMDLETGSPVLVFAGSPVGEDGHAYPPIEWFTACIACNAAKPAQKVPQVWTRADTHRLLGCIWEIVVRYENGDYEHLNPEVYCEGESQTVTDSRAKRFDAIKALVCEVHAHLGTENYADFIKL